MFTFIFLYVSFYYITLAFIFFFFSVYNFPKNFLQFNNKKLWQIIDVYLPTPWFFKLLFLQLSGLPPMIFFFIKFNFLLAAIPHTTIIVQLLVFLNTLVSSFFYLNLFSSKNIIVNRDDLKSLTKHNSTIKNNHFNETKLKYNYIYSLLFFYFINFFSIFFFFDIFTYVNSFFI